MTGNNFAKQSMAMFLPAPLPLAILSVNAGAQEILKAKFGTWKLNLQKSKFPAGRLPLAARAR